MPVPPILRFFKLHPNVQIPTLATAGSACFDLSYFPHVSKVKGFSATNAPFERDINADGGIGIMQGERLLLPTGLIADIPLGYSMRVHPRSGTSVKLGLTLANAEGIIDSDYVEEIFLTAHNTSQNRILINRGDRIAQGELYQDLKNIIQETLTRPVQKTTRQGGFGSTGV